MTYATPLASSFNDTRTRSSRLSPQSGMCSFCSADCLGTCEIGLSAIRGAQTVYPTNTGENQVASEKDYPVDYSHFNINGRVFGAWGVEEHADIATIFNVNLEQTIGWHHPVKTALPLLLPALIKLNWQDYFAGAAMAGVCCVVGEGSPSRDPNAVFQSGKIIEFPFLQTILDSFKIYDRGYGQIALQCNFEDDACGLPEYALQKCGVEAIEFKLGQSAKGTQPVKKLKDYAHALKERNAGVLVHPDPFDPVIQAAHEEGCTPNFFSYSRLPVWTEDYLLDRIEMLRDMGLKNVYFKMAGYDRDDIERLMRLASRTEVDMITFDGAGGGSGYSPCKMMNEWGLPTITLEETICQVAANMAAQGLQLPAMTITGGFATEDQVFKALAFGSPFVGFVGLCRASMAAANSAKKVGELIKEGKVPAHLSQYGTTVEELFSDLPDLRHLYGKRADSFSPGAIGVFSYLNRIAMGLRHFAALNRKFDVSLLDRNDLVPLTREAASLLNGGLGL